jgi:vancomycin resistance protein YoaR
MRKIRLNRAQILIALSAIALGGTSIVASLMPSHLGKDFNERIVRAEKVYTSSIVPISQYEQKLINKKIDELLNREIVFKAPIESLKDEYLKNKNHGSAAWTVPIKDYPDWIELKDNWISLDIELNHKKIQKFFEENILHQINLSSNAHIFAMSKYEIDIEGTKELLKAKIYGDTHDGWTLNEDLIQENIYNAIAYDSLEIEIPLQKSKGEVLNRSSADIGSMKLLSVGKSEFSGSVPARIFNIEKAMAEHVNGIIIPPGATFSFISAVGDIIEESTGWKTSLGIFNGNELKPTPGGGVCQASTTVYRAALAAGLPIEEQRNHSLYVKYYTKYGEGLDATIYPNHQDLKFRNDTPSYLLLLASVEGNEAKVRIYGTPDGRKVALNGPYRSHNAPSEVRGEPLWVRDIIWERIITHPAKKPESEVIISRYQDKIPDIPTYYEFEEVM